MKTSYIAISALALSLAATTTLATECESGYKETTVSGSVLTNNMSETQQVGSINMQLTTVGSGKVVFDQSGGIIGTIVGQTADDWERPVAILNHTIVFEDGSTIETSGDRATITGFVPECSLSVEEVISNFWGTQTFKRATGEIHATGSITGALGCPEPNQFTLSGTVCLKRAH